MAKHFLGSAIPKGFLFLRRNFQGMVSSDQAASPELAPDKQDLDIYWDPAFADALEHWGDNNVWHEIKFLMASCKGMVLDIACGSGKTIESLASNPLISVYGCDISDPLIQKAIDRGISRARLKICDATRTDYPDNSFDFSYSIGSLEHFTETGISEFIAECFRITRANAFHMVPVSRDDVNHGWIKPKQSYFNNSVAWWLDKFKATYSSVYVLDSLWNDRNSVGKWFICIKD